MHRRRFLAAAGAAASVGVAGCLSLFQTRSARSPPLVENRPDAVYLPSHVEGMAMVGVADVGDYRAALTYSFSHRFWLANGDRFNKVEVGGDDSLHLMSTVWDPETETVLPNGAVTTTITKDGDRLVEGRSLWPMLSQNMGVHAGDNLQLDGDGTYEVELGVGPLSPRRTGTFRDRFAERATVTFTMEFSQSALDGIPFERFPERQGERAALDPMEMDMLPVSRAPATNALPGTVLAEGSSGDARLVVTRLDDPPVGVEASDGAYLAVSLWTPYNRYPVPLAALSATVARGDTTVSDGPLTATVHPELGYHYGTVADARPGDDLTLTVDTPPQVARHEGYETAFRSFSTVSLTLGE